MPVCTLTRKESGKSSGRKSKGGVYPVAAVYPGQAGLFFPAAAAANKGTFLPPFRRSASGIPGRPPFGSRKDGLGTMAGTGTTGSSGRQVPVALGTEGPHLVPTRSIDSRCAGQFGVRGSRITPRPATAVGSPALTSRNARHRGRWGWTKPPGCFPNC